MYSNKLKLKKNHPSHFNWNGIHSPYPIEPNTHRKTQVSLKYASKVESRGKGYKVVSQFGFKCTS